MGRKVVDGAKALASAVTKVFDHPVIQRCQSRKIRNVEVITAAPGTPTRHPMPWRSCPSESPRSS